MIKPEATPYLRVGFLEWKAVILMHQEIESISFSGNIGGWLDDVVGDFLVIRSDSDISRGVML